MTRLHRTRICAGECIVWPWLKGTIDNVWSIWVQRDKVVGVGEGQFIIVVFHDPHIVQERRLVLYSGLGVDEAETFMDKERVIPRGTEKCVINENRYRSAATECEFDRKLCSSGRRETE